MVQTEGVGNTEDSINRGNHENKIDKTHQTYEKNKTPRLVKSASSSSSVGVIGGNTLSDIITQA